FPAQGSGADPQGDPSELRLVFSVQRRFPGRSREFIAKDLPVFTYNEKGDLITDYPYIQTDCYYEGFVEDVPGSVVSLSTCSGLSGLLKVEDRNYDIEPIEDSSSFQHLIFQVAADEDSPDRCGVTGDFLENQPAEKRELPTNESRKYDPRYHTLYGHTRYLEFFLTSDKLVYKRLEENETKVLNSMLLLTSILNTMYTSLNLRIVLVGTEIWTEVDQITVTHLLDHAFHFFAPWARRFLKPRIYFDHAQLLLGRHYRGTLGLATQGTVCNTDASTSIIRFSNNENVYNAAGSAHELGHALIFGHDDEAGNVARFCRCPGCKERCIMRSKLS
ncbi:disintegrin and metalloproteinase domain-containing protein 9-like, partial [Alligator sinensis]|uniref:Disintegrin and metalloproteinase domain-containing protein 9-like n=1 Tax=Alligator sinensis TaxID=38654 RepID=A0A1U8DNY1_ALLSI